MASVPLLKQIPGKIVGENLIGVVSRYPYGSKSSFNAVRSILGLMGVA